MQILQLSLARCLNDEMKNANKLTIISTLSSIIVYSLFVYPQVIPSRDNNSGKDTKMSHLYVILNISSNNEWMNERMRKDVKSWIRTTITRSGLNNNNEKKRSRLEYADKIKCIAHAKLKEYFFLKICIQI